MSLSRSGAVLASLALSMPLVAQGTTPTTLVDWALDSGTVANDGLSGSDEREAVLSFLVVHDGASTLALHFADVQLAGRLGSGRESLLRVTSLLDAAEQVLDARHVAQWERRTAYFNGDSLLVEVLAAPGTGDNRLVLRALEVGTPASPQETQCGPLDDRQPSFDNRVARLMPIGCTAWMLDDCGKCFLSAGHCSGGGGSVLQFNVPMSSAGGSVIAPPPQDQYAVDGSSYQFENASDDWQYFGVFANSNTGLTPYETYGAGFALATPPGPGGRTIRITGYGTDSSPNLTFNQIQQTHTGPLVGTGTNLNYQTDTTGGNSGSPVIWEEQGVAIGIHTNGGCSTSGSGSNSGTPITASALQAALANPSGVCDRSAQAATVFRNGSGINPASFFPVTPPVIGFDFHSQVDVATPGATASVVAFSTNGPTSGLVFSVGELLCVPPFSTSDVAVGTHAVGIPNDCILIGKVLNAQGATVRTAPFELQLTNAIDITIGTF